MGFRDLRPWLDLLAKDGERRGAPAEAHQDREIAAAAGRVREKREPALPFAAITGNPRG